MANEQEEGGYADYSGVRDLEERHRILKDKVRLVGENLIDLREKNNEQILEIKKEIESMKDVLNRVLSFMESASDQFSKYARKEDLEILSKQAKMFQPLLEETSQERQRAKNKN